MKVKLLSESGYGEALFGLGLSYGITSQMENFSDFYYDEAFDKMESTALKLCDKDYGHNKYLESMMLWIDVTAPRFWWQEADTYRLSTKQSASKMHSLHKREVNNDDFLYPIPEYYLIYINLMIKKYLAKEIIADELMGYIPEGYLQRRVWVMSYKTLKNINIQRCNHRLNEWKLFLSSTLGQIRHPEFIINK